TVLSRCLQFNLKQMPAGHIVDHLAHILGEEQIAFDNQALRLLAKAANGSMRDALSLTDQAIAYAAGPVSEEAVRGMLGAIDQSVLVRILDALHAGTPKDLIDLADELASRSFSFSAALQDMGSLLHKVALAQMAPDAVSDDWPEAADVRRLAGLFTPEEVQLHYQIVTRARSELGLAPDEHSGFSMALLRMAAFRPLLSASSNGAGGMAPSGGGDVRAAPRATPSAAAAEAAPAASAPAASAPAATGASMSPAKAALAALQASSRSAPPAARRAPAVEPRQMPEPAVAPSAPVAEREIESAHAEPSPSAKPIPAAETKRADSHDAPLFNGEWPALAAQLPLRGLAQQLALQSELLSVSGRRFHLRVPLKQLGESGPSDKLREALGAHFGTPVELVIEIGAVNATAAAVAAEVRAQQQQAAEQAIGNDAFVQALMNEFGAQIVPGSIRPVQ
ncbi:MAG: DNA polymerase III subunit gamma/tau, partial [Burkholderiales bacterium]|nr:DNA polymerase III subunit gamma/tau [Burkholderiales bacterium]